ncbi:MAG: radical SAM protein [Candidatus Acidiferrales bacterium]
MLKKLHLYLIRPTQYDDEGYVVRHWHGVLPSNTLACLAGLTEDVVAQKRLGESVQVKVHVLDETVDHIPVKRICRSQRDGQTKTIICLAGVQTNQFPRAADLARVFRRAGLTVMIGGFHVSGYLALMPSIPPDIQELMDDGTTIVKGEVEERWGDLLCDAMGGCLKPLYDFTNDKPDLSDKPLPVIRKEYLRKFIASNFGTLDCGRGCPYDCSFCTIINVQGRKMRFRSAERTTETIRHNYNVHGITFYFFTDDNFARNKKWEAILDALIRLREEEHIPVKFMMQVDVLSWKIPNFIAKARRAGCSSVFIGMESLNPDSLKAAGKQQNHVQEYPQLIEAYRSSGISTHVGYIIGFPNDTVDSVRQDLTQLMQDVRPDHASFFMLMPLPGSRDHFLMSRRGEWMHPDFNQYDSHHAVTVHPHLKNGSWEDLYREAWQRFYSFENMKAILQRCPRRDYWNNFLRFVWYKNSIQTEGRHPMMCGFFRLKGRKNRRPGYPIESRWGYTASRAREIRAHLAAMFRLLFEMEELWLQTRQRGEAEQRVIEELGRIRAATYGRLKLADLQLAYRRAKAYFPALQVPSKLQLFWVKWYPLLAPGKVLTRADLDCFWHTAKQRWTQRRWFQFPSLRLPFNLFRDVQLCLIFLANLARAS